MSLAAILSLGASASYAAHDAGRPVGEGWMTICSSNGVYYYNMLTGEKRVPKDAPQTPFGCHSTPCGRSRD